jgi:uncharacterized protein YqjF (DUF2071 family)
VIASPTAPEPVTPIAPDRTGRTLLTQLWLDLAFLHWAVDPALVAPLRNRRPPTPFPRVNHLG